MKRLLCIVFLVSLPAAIFASEQDILREIRHLREDMNKRFEQVDKRFEQVDKRFEQVDKRFEQVDKRFEFIQAILVALIALAIGTPVLLEYFARRRDARDAKHAEETRKIIFALREVVEKDPRLDKALRHVGLL